MHAPARSRPQAPSRSRRRSRRGFTIVELTMSVFLLAIAMTTTVQVLGWVARERRAVERRQWAILEVGNLMERITAEPWDRVTPESARALTLSEEVRRKLPEPELTTTVIEEDSGSDSGLEAKRVSIRLRWHERSGEWVTPVRLTAWMSRRGGGR